MPHQFTASQLHLPSHKHHTSLVRPSPNPSNASVHIRRSSPTKPPQFLPHVLTIKHPPSSSPSVHNASLQFNPIPPHCVWKAVWDWIVESLIPNFPTNLIRWFSNWNGIGCWKKRKKENYCICVFIFLGLAKWIRLELIDWISWAALFLGRIPFLFRALVLLIALCFILVLTFSILSCVGFNLVELLLLYKKRALESRLELAVTTRNFKAKQLKIVGIVNSSHSFSGPAAIYHCKWFSASTSTHSDV